MANWKDIFKTVDIDTFNEPVFNIINNEWFLLTAGEKDKYNTMTASWGTLGILWNKPIAICFIRPTRHTFLFSEEADMFTMSFLNEADKDILKFCGAKSGRDCDKIAETGLEPIEMGHKGISFKQSRLVLECEKIYFDDLKPVFMLPNEIDDKYYSNKDYHRMYIGEVKGIYEK